VETIDANSAYAAGYAVMRTNSPSHWTRSNKSRTGTQNSGSMRGESYMEPYSGESMQDLELGTGGSNSFDLRAGTN
jgi:hypothetical protein